MRLGAGRCALIRAVPRAGSRSIRGAMRHGRPAAGGAMGGEWNELDRLFSRGRRLRECPALCGAKRPAAGSRRRRGRVQAVRVQAAAPDDKVVVGMPGGPDPALEVAHAPCAPGGHCAAVEIVQGPA